MSYEPESRAFDQEILSVIEGWQDRGEALDDAGFNDLALRLFDFQLRTNNPYARYCAHLGVTSPPASWEHIPAVPAPAFKEAALTTFDPAKAALVFETSGTTGGVPGRHYLETSALYDAASLAGFQHFVLRDEARLRFFNLVPNPADCRHSSLGYMMGRVSACRGDGRTGWYLRGDGLLFEEFTRDVAVAIQEKKPICLATTAFALVALLDEIHRRRLAFLLPGGSRVMETGGFKGRARVIERDELYAQACEAFGIANDAILGEYGMTELTSQYYDAAPPVRHKAGPPWLRSRVAGPDRRTLPPGEAGSLIHVDLANRSSCIAIQTEDLGVECDGGFVLLGRDAEASLRGCSLDAEELGLRSTTASGAK